MSYERRSVYFAKPELDLLKFVESEEGSFNFAIKNIVKHVMENDPNQLSQLLTLVRQLVEDVAEIKEKLHDLKQSSPQFAPLPLQKETNDGDAVAFAQVDRRDYSGFDDL